MLMTKEVLSEFAELIRENKCNPCDCCHRRR